MTSKWSSRTDGFGFWYGFYDGDHRQMNVRQIFVLNCHYDSLKYEGFVGGCHVGEWNTLAEAQVGCEEYIRTNQRGP